MQLMFKVKPGTETDLHCPLAIPNPGPSVSPVRAYAIQFLALRTQRAAKMGNRSDSRY